MVARVAAVKGSSQRETAKTLRKDAQVSQSAHSAQHPESGQARIFSIPAFHWNIGNVALHAPNDGTQRNSERGGRFGATQHAGSLPWPIQAKLEVGAVEDPLEHEADRVAKKVMRMPDAGAVAAPAVAGGGILGVQRKCSCGGTCAECTGEQADDGHGMVQRKTTGPQVSSLGSSPASSGMTAPPIVHEALNSPGRPLDSAKRAFMEPRFAFDFGGVRLHTGGAARSSTADLGALAYTVGSHIVLREESPSQELLAHELAHVVQQASTPTPRVQRGPGPGGGKGDPKFFDPSRGALTDAEKAKLLAVRKSFNLPDTPTAGDTSIVGILITETGQEFPFHSGERGGYHAGVRPADVKGGPGSGTNRVNRTHVETWAANQMRKLGLKRAVLLIELEPCAVCGGYGKGNPTVDTKVPGVSAQLPDDAQLIVVDGESANYFRKAPTDPQRPTRIASKPPKPPDDESGGTPQKKAPSGPTNENQPGGAGTGKSQQVKGQGAKAPTGTDVEPGGAGTGGHAPTQKTTGKPSQGGGASGMAIEVGTGIATLGLDWLAAYLKARVDQKIAARQIEAFLAAAKKKINANPDEAVKKMMADPNRTVYAWVYLESSVISTIGEDPSGQPTMSDSSPMIDLSRIDYMTAPLDQEMINSLPTISGGGKHITVTRPIVIDIPLTTPPFEDLVSYAKTRNLPLDDAYAYALGRYQAALSTLEAFTEAHQKTLNAYQIGNEVYQKLQAELQIAKKRNDLALQKSLTEKLVSVAQTMKSTTDRLEPIRESMQKAEQNLKYWEHIVDLANPAKPRP